MSNPTGKGGFQDRKDAINRNGRPRSFDALRRLAQEIAHEDARSGGDPLVIDGHTVTVAEAIMRQWAQSKNPVLQRAFIEIAFGKVPDEVKYTNTADKASDDLSTSEIAERAASIEALAKLIIGTKTAKDGPPVPPNPPPGNNLGT